MVNTMTKEAIDKITTAAVAYNHMARRIANGHNTSEDVAMSDEDYNTFVAMVDMLKALGFEIEESYEIIENYESVITSIKINGEVIFHG